MANKELKEFMEMLKKEKAEEMERKEERRRLKEARIEEDKANERRLREEEKANERRLREEEKANERRLREEEKANDRKLREEEQKQLYALISGKLEGVSQEINVEKERCLSQHKQVEERLEDIVGSIQVLEESTGVIKKKADENFKLITNRVTKVEQKVLELGGQPGMVRSLVMPRYEGECKKIEFWGNPHERPQQFIREIENLIEETNPFFSDQEKLKFAVRQLRGCALEWWQIMQTENIGYTGFKECFLKNYWSLQKQKLIRNKIEYGRYNDNSNLTRADYFCKLVNKARDLDPPIPEGYLVFTIFQHFNDQIRLAAMGKHSETVREAIQFLSNIDMMEEARRGNRPTGTPNNNNNNRQNPQPYPRPNLQSYSQNPRNTIHPNNPRPGPSNQNPNSKPKQGN